MGRIRYITQKPNTKECGVIVCLNAFKWAKKKVSYKRDFAIFAKSVKLDKKNGSFRENIIHTLRNVFYCSPIKRSIFEIDRALGHGKIVFINYRSSKKNNTWHVALITKKISPLYQLVGYDDISPYRYFTRKQIIEIIHSCQENVMFALRKRQ